MHHTVPPRTPLAPGWSDWRKSRRSGGQSDCVEVANGPGVVGIRDTKNRSGGVLVVDRDSFAALVGAMKSGRL
ncbi:DUF397 domain-containing protein [Actinoalloteichus sp. AHMU CJ021]|uniref:DUF397 domain-containing protein n=1 Tax=Actinoalloteichus caeruleus DSM 43889 TaxID=1120930 RepID=A0ABT1JGN6_ACTCY|nr:MULTISPECIES: DUF397 domain-containing protein [Actinoalloteichus]AUS77717.1 DUF397 domain-containing protein [Actinoalloteichus sp. AHMU CJ021]MCP2331641.1 protein of unknown function (DUF397) [Actinoalloteichus caeruleus DSM 43889]